MKCLRSRSTHLHGFCNNEVIIKKSSFISGNAHTHTHSEVSSCSLINTHVHAGATTVSSSSGRFHSPLKPAEIWKPTTPNPPSAVLVSCPATDPHTAALMRRWREPLRHQHPDQCTERLLIHPRNRDLAQNQEAEGNEDYGSA